MGEGYWQSQRKTWPIYRASQTLIPHSGSLHGTDLSFLHICYSSWLPTVGTEAVFNSFNDFSNPPPHIGSPWLAVIYGEMFSLTETWYAMICWFLWEMSPFLNRKREERDWGCEYRVGLGKGLSRVWRRNCGKDIIIMMIMIIIIVLISQREQISK